MAEPMERPRPGGTDRGQMSADGRDGVRVHRPCDPYDDPRQLSIDDALEEARRRRDAGMKSAEHSTDIQWNRVAAQVIRGLAATGRPFNAEHVREVTGDPIGSPNAMGAAFGKAARAGVIVRVGSQQSTRPEAAGRWLAVWRGTGGA